MTSQDWASILDCTEKGPRANLTNLVRVLDHDPTLGHERIWYDEFLDRVMVRNSEPRPWRDDDTTRLTVYIQDSTGLRTIASDRVREAMEMVARRRPKHVVRDWLTTLQWDGTPRIATAFATYWQAQDTEYLQAASRNFFIGMVARVLQPGCKLDTMPVFEGPQGIRKSSALEALASPAWFATVFENVTNKDFFQNMRGKWLMEIAELQSFSRADITAVKSMLSTRHDTYRPSYGRTAVDYPRQSVFAGTTNEHEWGSDETGLRRFWPVACGLVDVEGLARDRSSLFAEAVQLLTAGGSWWDMPAAQTLEQQERRQHFDDWIPIVQAWIALQSPDTDLTSGDVLRGALKFDASAIHKGHSMRIAKVLRFLGYQRALKRDGSSIGRVWTLGESPSDVSVF